MTAKLVNAAENSIDIPPFFRYNIIASGLGSRGAARAALRKVRAPQGRVTANGRRG